MGFFVVFNPETTLQEDPWFGPWIYIDWNLKKKPLGGMAGTG